MIDHQVHGHERIDLERVATGALHGRAHGGEVDDARDAGEILQDDAGDLEGDFVGRIAGGVKVNMVGLLIFQQATLTADLPFAAAVSSVLFATSLLLLVVYAWVGSALNAEARSR